MARGGREMFRPCAFRQAPDFMKGAVSTAKCVRCIVRVARVVSAAGSGEMEAHSLRY